jgi:hypothetical protein
VLHVTCGDCAVLALRAAGIAGEVLVWREVLHDGPVPGGLDAAQLRSVRARFLSNDGRASEPAAATDFEARDARLAAAVEAHEPVRVWFEADLYDVLLVMQILDRVPAGAPVELALAGEDAWMGVTELEPAELARLGEAAPQVTAAQLELARQAWAAFRADDPRGLERLADGTPPLPCIGEAVARLLEEYPWTESGLSRTERQLLEAFADGPSSREAAFHAAAVAEERPFLGDTSAWATLDRLAPLLEGDALSDRGRAVLTGSEFWVPSQERWIGGVRLPPGPSPWRWNPDAARLEQAEVAGAGR